MLEKTIENYLASMARANGGIAIKQNAKWYPGIPDRFVLLPHGRFVAVETKRPSQSRTYDHQTDFHSYLESIGFEVVKAYVRADIEAIFSEHG